MLLLLLLLAAAVVAAVAAAVVVVVDSVIPKAFDVRRTRISPNCYQTDEIPALTNFDAHERCLKHPLKKPLHRL